MDHEIGSGNVFADLGFPDEDAAAALVKARLIGRLRDALDERRLAWPEIERRLGADQATLSGVLRGRMQSVSVERLTFWLTRLGYDVTLTVKPSDADHGHFAAAE